MATLLAQGASAVAVWTLDCERLGRLCPLQFIDRAIAAHLDIRIPFAQIPGGLVGLGLLCLLPNPQFQWATQRSIRSR